MITEVAASGKLGFRPNQRGSGYGKIKTSEVTVDVLYWYNSCKATWEMGQDQLKNMHIL